MRATLLKLSNSPSKRAQTAQGSRDTYACLSLSFPSINRTRRRAGFHEAKNPNKQTNKTTHTQKG